MYNHYFTKDTYKLGDFGSASFQNATEHVGTLDYAAPEIVTQQSYN